MSKKPSRNDVESAIDALNSSNDKESAKSRALTLGGQYLLGIESQEARDQEAAELDAKYKNAR